MPIKDGFEATEEIRSMLHNNFLPQPIVSCISDSAGKEEAYDNGMNNCMPKPVQWKELDQLLTTLNFAKSAVGGAQNDMMRLATAMNM